MEKILIKRLSLNEELNLRVVGYRRDIEIAIFERSLLKRAGKHEGISKSNDSYWFF